MVGLELQRVQIASAVVVVLGCVLRLVWLDADPDYYIWAGYIIDEGRWIENVRAFLLHDELLLPESNLHLLVAPLFQAVNYLVCYLLDLNRISVRIFSALCGCAILLIFWRSLHRLVSSYALVLGLALVAFQEDLVMLSRVCVPEVPAMLLELGTFVALVRARDRLRGVFLAGVLMTVCIGLKATTAPLLFVFGVVACFCDKPDLRTCSRRLLVFWAPTLACCSLAALIVLAFRPDYFQSNLVLLYAAMSDLPRAAQFLGLNSAYGIVSFPFDNPMAATLNVWLVGAWLGALVATVSTHLLDASARRWLAASATWTLGYASSMQAFSYFPDRYKAHLLVPLAILATVSVHSFSRVGLKAIWQATVQLAAGRRLFAYGLLALPSAVLVAPGLLWALSYLGLESDRLLWKMLAISAAWVLLALVSSKRGRAWFEIAIWLPLAAFPAWLVGHQLLGWSFWTEADSTPYFPWMITLGVALVVFALSRRATAGGGLRGRLLLATAVAYMAISVAPYAPSLIWPRFTLRDTSRELGTLLEDYRDIANCRADGLFVDNDLQHQSLYRVDWRDSLPQILVLMDLKPDPCPGDLKDLLATDYRPLESYELYISPRYGYDTPVRVAVYALERDLPRQ